MRFRYSSVDRIAVYIVVYIPLISLLKFWHSQVSINEVLFIYPNFYASSIHGTIEHPVEGCASTQKDDERAVSVERHGWF